MKIKRLIIFFLIIVILGVFAYFQPQLGLTGKTTITEYDPEPALVLRTIDGDTIEVEIDNTNYTIRLLGINTPEKGRPYYDDAKDFMSQIEGEEIEVLRDWEDEDKYDRKLRYVLHNSRNLNIESVEKGLATAYMVEGLRYEDKLIRAQEYARDSELGLWKKSTDECVKCIRLLEVNAEDEYFIIENICNSDCDLTGWYVKDASRNIFKLSPLDAGEQNTTFSKRAVWNNDGDEFFMRDAEGLLVIYEVV